MSVQATFTATLVDEWVHGGVTDAVICPGSRSTPLALALVGRLRVHVRLDERSAAFYALGLAQASGRPAIICVTSGTAAAEVHPAVVEAHHGRVPLIVCTADRPPELHHVGASQTIEQVGLFTAATRWACDPGVAVAGQEATWRPLAARALVEATQGPYGPGPVHLNLAFRDPLVGEPDDLPARSGPTVVAASPLPWVLDPPLSGSGMVIAGGGATRHPERLLQLGDALGWPVLADPRSGGRLEGTIAAADAIMRAAVPLADTIVLLGSSWLSKAVNDYVARSADAGARVIVVDPWGQWTDPMRVATEFHRVDPDAWITGALASARAPAPGTDPAWLMQWRDYERRAQAAIDAALGQDLSEPLAARVVARHAGAVEATLMAAASMPIRDLEWYAPALPAPPAVMANRGANGIDGVVSTALGLTAAGRRTFALMGDLTFLHDVSGLVNFAGLPCTFVVLDNRGGGIFSFLPQASALKPDTFEHLFGTPPTSDVSAVARGFGLRVREVANVAELDAALLSDDVDVIRVRLPGRAENVARHDEINQAVSRALE
jgi:2-succinyl-5-enolpyruvyl-6-hydroxy-3-cyclohexene-1-carboxylate synthase